MLFPLLTLTSTQHRKLTNYLLPTCQVQTQTCKGPRKLPILPPAQLTSSACSGGMSPTSHCYRQHNRQKQGAGKHPKRRRDETWDHPIDMDTVVRSATSSAVWLSQAPRASSSRWGAAFPPTQQPRKLRLTGNH